MRRLALTHHVGRGPLTADSRASLGAPFKGLTCGADRRRVILGISRGARRSDGVSFPELLVVILVATILAALVIPALLSQKTKSTDAQAKELVRTAQTTAESIATDNDGKYEKVSAAELRVIEPSIVTGKGVPTKDAWLTHASGTSSSYKVTATASSGDTFTIERNKDEITRSCTQVNGSQGCPTGSW